MITFNMLYGHQEYELGHLPTFLSPSNPKGAREQLNDNYGHGGGWRPFNGFRRSPSNNITYPGDPTMSPIAITHLREELILVYPHAWVMVVQPDDSFEICRMD